ncbi:MAG: DNA-deoxyinosine glycosylase [Syntrophorhabdaceae bacterium]
MTIDKFSPTSCLPPVVGAKPRVLILGSFPGKESLKRKEYYGNPRNQFWRIMGDIFGTPPEIDYADRIAILTQKGVCLWDVVSSCYRDGSADAKIRKPHFNDIRQFLAQYPSIRVIYFDGKTAANMFIRGYLKKTTLDIPHFPLPSTSPAHAAMPYQEKLKQWSAIKGWVKKQ